MAGTDSNESFDGHRFWNYIDPSAVGSKYGTHSTLVKFLRNVNASIGDSIVERSFAGKTLKSSLSRISGTHTMHRDAGLVVKPDHLFTG
jgi:hypothetical protein